MAVVSVSLAFNHFYVIVKEEQWLQFDISLPENPSFDPVWQSDSVLVPDELRGWNIEYAVELFQGQSVGGCVISMW